MAQKTKSPSRGTVSMVIFRLNPPVEATDTQALARAVQNSRYEQIFFVDGPPIEGGAIALSTK
jgi:hypothetical protein